MEYDYNNAGDNTVVLVKLNSSDKYRTDYSYFKNGWLKQVTAYEYSGGWQQKAQVEFDYDKLGRRLTIDNADGSGVQTALAYNSRSETRSILHSAAAALYGLTPITPVVPNWSASGTFGTHHAFRPSYVAALLGEHFNCNAPFSLADSLCQL